MGLDTKYLQFLMDCVNGKKSDDILDVTKHQIGLMLSNGKTKDDKELLREILPFIDKSNKKKKCTKKICDRLRGIIDQKNSKEADDVQKRYRSIGCGSTSLS